MKMRLLSQIVRCGMWCCYMIVPYGHTLLMYTALSTDCGESIGIWLASTLRKKKVICVGGEVFSAVNVV
jgi:hypothetical protein